MDILLRLAWRNLWRHSRRTWLTASAIAFVTVLMVFLITLQLGSYDLMIDSSLRIFTGQMQVQRQGYFDKPQIRKVIPEASALAQQLRQIPSLTQVNIAVRAQTFALATSGTRSYGAQVVGVQPEYEPRVSTIPHLIKSGRYFSGGGTQEAVVGATLAHNLNIAVGDELTLLGSARDGSVAATIVSVAGLFDSGMREIDRHVVQLPLRTFQDLFGMDHAAHAIVFVAPELKQLKPLERDVAAMLPAGEDLVVLDWERLVPGLKQLIQADWTTGWFTYLALIVVVTFSILNTFIMSVLERTREFGTMLALGAGPLRIGTMVMFESLFLTLLGIVIGVGIGLLIAFYLSVHGFTYPGLKELMGQYGMPGLIYPKLSFVSVGLGPAVILLCILVTSIYPALRIRRLNAVEAMHAV